jgi:hypothetical protein
MTGKAAPAPYSTVDVGSTAGFHTYLTDAGGRKIGVAWGPKDEKVWTAALWAAAPDMLAALKRAIDETYADERGDKPEWYAAAVAAIARATGE